MTLSKINLGFAIPVGRFTQSLISHSPRYLKYCTIHLSFCHLVILRGSGFLSLRPLFQVVFLLVMTVLAVQKFLTYANLLMFLLQFPFETFTLSSRVFIMPLMHMITQINKSFALGFFKRLRLLPLGILLNL